MPWKVFSDNGRHCVYKVGPDGERVGQSLGCHDGEAEAMAQMRALYVSEAKSVKFAGDGTDETLIEMNLTPAGGIFNGRDLDQQFFSAKTDFCLPWRPDASYPVLYHHGLDPDAGTSVVGRGKSLVFREDGGWLQAQLDASSKYFAALKELIKQGKLYASSGAMAHLVQVDSKSGEILRWPLVEASLTPTPSNLLATVDFATAEKHYKAAGLDPAPLKAMSEKQMRSMMAEMASEMDMAMSDEQMTQMMASLDADMPEDEMRGAMRKKMQAARRQMMGEKAADLLEIVIDESGLSEALGGWPIATHAEAVKALAASLTERTKDLRERRIKEGRVMSGMNRKRIRECLDAMDGAMSALRDLYDSTEPQAKATTDMRLLRARAQIKALEIQALAV